MSIAWTSTTMGSSSAAVRLGLRDDVGTDGLLLSRGAVHVHRVGRRAAEPALTLVDRRAEDPPSRAGGRERGNELLPGQLALDEVERFLQSLHRAVDLVLDVVLERHAGRPLRSGVQARSRVQVVALVLVLARVAGKSADLVDTEGRAGAGVDRLVRRRVADQADALHEERRLAEEVDAGEATATDLAGEAGTVAGRLVGEEEILVHLTRVADAGGLQRVDDRVPGVLEVRGVGDDDGPLAAL